MIFFHEIDKNKSIVIHDNYEEFNMKFIIDLTKFLLI